MEEILKNLAEANSLVSAAVVGALFAVLGTIVALAITTASKKAAPHKRNITIFSTILFIALGNGLFQGLVKPYQHEARINASIEEMKEIKLFNLIFEAHPEELDLLKAELQKAKTTLEAEDIARNWSSSIMVKYYYGYLAKADNEDVRRYIQYSASLIEGMRDRPDDCYAYFMGLPNNDFYGSEKEVMLKEVEFKGEIVESGMKNKAPSDFIDAQQIMASFAQAYVANGYDPADLENVALIDSLPREQSCKIGINFTKTLAAMGDDGAQVLKTLTAMQFSQQ